MTRLATATGSNNSHSTDATSDDHASSGTRWRYIPAGRSAVTVVAMQIAANTRATSTRIIPAIVSAAASGSTEPAGAAPRPPSTAIEIEKMSAPTSHAHNESAAARG